MQRFEFHVICCNYYLRLKSEMQRIHVINQSFMTFVLVIVIF